MNATMQCVVLDCPNPAALARFYQTVLGGPTGAEGKSVKATLRDSESLKVAFTDSQIRSEVTLTVQRTNAASGARSPAAAPA